MPPVLVAREAQLSRWLGMLAEVEQRGRKRAVDTIVVGPRGVGKTVLLEAMSEQARAMGHEVVAMQAARGTETLMPYLFREIKRRAEDEAPFRAAWRRLESLSVGLFGVSVGGSRAVQDDSPADLTGMDLAAALADLARAVRADRERGGLLLTIDEMQVAGHRDLALLAATLGRLNTEHPDAPVLFGGAGLLNVRQHLRDAGVTHPDRLFRLTELPTRFSRDETTAAVMTPALELGVHWQADAVAAVYGVSGGYPAHVQLYAHAIWQHAAGPGITVEDARAAISQASDEVALSTLGPDWDDLTDREREYAAAVSVLGGRALTRDVAAVLRQQPGSISRLDGGLVRKGFVYRPTRGVVELTMPLQRPYILQVYEESRVLASVALAPLAELAARATEVAPGSPQLRER
jgi:hypothetical protein